LGANDRINIACIGVGGKGDSDSRDAAAHGANIIAICDVDKRTQDKKLRNSQIPRTLTFNNAPKRSAFRTTVSCLTNGQGH